MKEITSDEMYGIAKKFNRDMEELPMHTHSAIVEMVRVGMQHRNLAMQKADKERADDIEARKVKAMEQHVALEAAQAQREAANEMRPELVTQQ